METQSKAVTWAGRVLTALAAVPFVFSFIMKFMGGPQVVEGMNHLGWPQTMMIPLGILEAACVILYLIPPVSVLGAIILTGYLGGAIATHVRIGEPVITHIVIGLFIWGGIFLREARLRELLPIRAKPFAYEREITINQPHDVVFAYLKALRNFKNWNPFLKKDPQAKTEYRGTDGQEGFTASWDGNREMGAGEQEITRVIEGRKIEFELRFKRPFKGTNAGYFSAEPVGPSQTKVRWGMSGRPVFPMSLIGLFIDCEKMIGRDFEAGLSRLKTILEG